MSVLGDVRMLAYLSLWEIVRRFLSYVVFSTRSPDFHLCPFHPSANGFLCFGPATFVSSAFILSQFAQKGCKFIRFEDGEDVSRMDDVVESMGVDCWRSANGIDFRYSESYEFSSEHQLARKMALATTIMGAIVWGSYFLASCVRFPTLIWLVMSLTLMATCICEGLMFRFFDDPVCQVSSCSLSTSSKCGISATVFWGISSLMTCGIFGEQAQKNSQGEEEE
ncbi:hypothetical protein ACHAWF_010765 [Thalassiosira exigua]